MAGIGKPDQIIISRAMIDVLSENPKFICRFVGKADFHGKAGTVELFEILTEKLELKEKKKSRIVSESVAPTDEAERQGRLIGEKYFIEKLIGEGAYGKVYKARHAATKDIVAIKMLPEDAYAFYSREAQVLRQLQPCPYIMSILDAFVDSEGLCIVMPYIEHGSLQTYMNKLPRRAAGTRADDIPDRGTAARDRTRPFERCHPPGRQAPEHSVGEGNRWDPDRFRHRLRHGIDRPHLNDDCRDFRLHRARSDVRPF